ncbi:MAG: hypothetical protein E6I16_05420 [Chloroflexi bacterium]|nr:MAG: hypothetical protein E6I16_05420 [Chloroflexota bacterium]
MLRGLFGSGPRVRVFLQPGAALSKEVLRAHRLRHTPALAEHRAGQTTNFIVFSDGTSNGDAAAQAMLASAEGDFQATQQWFGRLTLANLPFYVYVDPNAGGAYHLTCAGTDVHVLSDPALAPGFLTAEIVEVFEAARNNGWDCGFTNGESLSRVLAFDRHPEIAGDFNQTEQDWWASGHPDHVNDNSAGDTDQLASGCGDLFLYYLRSQLTFDWPSICSAGGSTLGACYRSLTGYEPAQGFSDFITALKTIDQGGTLALPPSGNPFPVKI